MKRAFLMKMKGLFHYLSRAFIEANKTFFFVGESSTLKGTCEWLLQKCYINTEAIYIQTVWEKDRPTIL